MKEFKAIILKKLTSRKFWFTLIGVGAGVAQLFGADGNAVGTICGALLALVPAVIYIITEGKIDEKGAIRLAQSVSDAIDIVTGGDSDKSDSEPDDSANGVELAKQKD